MRKTLFAAAAMAPLVFMLGGTANAAVTIASNTSTPHTTAVDGDITINSGVTVQPTTAVVAAITINSSNSVTNNGAITFSELNNVTGVLIQGGYTGALTNAGSITVSEAFTATDTNGDGALEAPFASTASTGRYGIRSTGAAAFTGSITNSGMITVKGNNSYGISLEAPLTGSLTSSSTVGLAGNGSVGIQETAGVSGSVTLTGAVNASGTGTKAVVLSGDVGGVARFYNSVTSIAYGAATRPSSVSLLTTVQGNSAETQQAGSALTISGNVAGGVFLGAPPAYTNNADTTSDRDADGIKDNVEGTAAIITYGNAAAMQVGGATAITLGKFDPTNANDNGYGLIIEGTVQGNGLYDGVKANGLNLGGGAGLVTVSGGLKVSGTVGATAYAADATALRVGNNANVPTIENLGTIVAAIQTPNVNSSGAFPAYSGNATALLIDATGSVSTLINSGRIGAGVIGNGTDTINATAVLDLKGNLSTVTNTGTIGAAISVDSATAVISSLSKSTALDLRTNSTGVTFTQQMAPTTVVTTVTTSSVPVVTVTTTPAATGTIAITTATTDTSVTTGSTTVRTIIPVTPATTGDIYLGSGANTVNIFAGTVTGNLDMGSGAGGSITIDHGAIYTGALKFSGTGLAVNVTNGTLNNSGTTTIAASSLNIGATGVLYFGVDPKNSTAARLNVTGSVNILNGAKLGLTFLSNATTAQNYTLVSGAGLFSVGATDTALSGPVPYIFDATIHSDALAKTITLSISPKTAVEMGLNPSQAGALAATYNALNSDSAVQNIVLAQYSRDGFLGIYNQILPDYSGGTFQIASAASLAIARASAEPNTIENPASPRGAWIQELTVGVNQDKGETPGFHGGAVGFVGGVETGAGGLGAVGVTAAYVTSTITQPDQPGDSQTSFSELEVGGYWRGEMNGWVADARVGAGYAWFNGRRELRLTNSSGAVAVNRKLENDWTGYTLSGRVGLAYQWQMGGGWFVQPQVHLDYFRLNEDAYGESQTVGGNAFALSYNSRTGQSTSGTASLVIGRAFGTGLVWRPQLELGVRDVFSGDAGDTTAKFVSGGSAFTLTPAEITGAAGVARLKIKASSEYYELGFEAGGEIRSGYQEGDVRFVVRVLF